MKLSLHLLATGLPNRKRHTSADIIMSMCLHYSGAVLLYSSAVLALVSAHKHLRFTCESIDNSPSDGCIYECLKADYCVAAYEDGGQCVMVRSDVPSTQTILHGEGRTCWCKARRDQLQAVQSPTTQSGARKNLSARNYNMFFNSRPLACKMYVKQTHQLHLLHFDTLLDFNLILFFCNEGLYIQNN